MDRNPFNCYKCSNRFCLVLCLTDNVANCVKYTPLVLDLIVALLSGFQTFLNLQKKIKVTEELEINI